MLGPVDLMEWWLLAPTNCERCDSSGPCGGRESTTCPWGACPHDAGANRLDWIICGGESGPHARPMHPDWVRSLRDQCRDAGVPFLFKQWGEWRPPADGEDFNTAFGMSGKPPAFLVSPAGSVHCFYPPGDTAVRPQDSVHKAMVRVGKRAAGRQLDGHEHSEWPA